VEAQIPPRCFDREGNSGGGESFASECTVDPVSDVGAEKWPADNAGQCETPDDAVTDLEDPWKFRT
jgi:hypothetical protein